MIFVVDNTQLLLTCEHATHWVPPQYSECFRGAEAVLKSHRGWDPGALETAQSLADELKLPLSVAPATRLLVEPNRSLHHRQLFSEFTRRLPADIKQEILRDFYHPHRKAVTSQIHRAISDGCRVVHLGIHSFTPSLNGIERPCDLGLLYDPQRQRERELCLQLGRQFKSARADVRVRMNYPYRGAADGLTTSLRRQFDGSSYLGIELEFNQMQLLDDRSRLLWVRAVADAVRQIVSP